MDLNVTEEQRMLRGTARQVIERHVSWEQLARVREAGGFDPELWQAAGSVGWPGALVPPPAGEGMTVEEAVALLEETGRRLAPIPLVSAVVTSWLVHQAAGERQRESLLPAMTAGEVVTALIGVAGQIGDPPAADPVQMTCSGRLVGASGLVRDAQVCLQFACVVPMRDGNHVVIVPRDAPGVSVEPRTTVGGLREAAVSVDVPVDAAVVLSQPLDRRCVSALEALVTILETAEIIGACETVLELTRTHATSRVQFGRPIGSFPAVQHRMADMLTDLDGSRWTLYRAASEMAAGAPPGPLVDHLATWTADATRRILQSAHQVHGGVGFIREHPLHLFFGRQKAYELTWGVPGGRLERLATALLGAPDEQGS